MAETETGAIIRIHEDDWGMRTLHPMAAHAEVAEDLRKAIEAEEKNRDPSGFGWTEMYEAERPSICFVDVGLKLADAAAALRPIMPRVKRFYANNSSTISSAEQDPLGSYEDAAWCFGLGPQCYLKLDLDGDYVRDIWFGFDSSSSEEAAALQKCFEAIDLLVPSFIADYFLNIDLPIADGDQIGRYFAFLQSQGSPRSD